jgi:ribosomal protein L12E/L44/L45/RPP1/RPP2
MAQEEACIAQVHKDCVGQTFVNCTRCQFENPVRCTINGSDVRVRNGRSCTVTGLGNISSGGSGNTVIEIRSGLVPGVRPLNKGKVKIDSNGLVWTTGGGRQSFHIANVKPLDAGKSIEGETIRMIGPRAWLDGKEITDLLNTSTKRKADIEPAPPAEKKKKEVVAITVKVSDPEEDEEEEQ